MAKVVLLTAVGAGALLISGCGDSSTTSTSPASRSHVTPAVATSDADAALSLYLDNDEKGDPQLGSDRIRITPHGLWTPVYWVPLEDLAKGEELIAAVDIQLTNCRPSDLTASSDSSCKGTAPYNLSPEISTRLVLSGKGGDGRPSLKGAHIGPSHTLDCTAKLHHCVAAQFGKLPVQAEETGNRFVSLFVRARDPKAKPCKPAKPKDCNVLQLTHGQGRLGVARERTPGIEPPVRVTSKEQVHQLPLAKTKQQKQSSRRVVYSIKLDKPGPVIAESELFAEFGLDYPTPPLVNKELILAKSPTATTGHTVDPQNGENCQGKCRYIELGLLPCLTQADLDAGYEYLNLVAFSSRASAFASPRNKVRIRPGGYLGVREYRASLAPEACSSDKPG